MSEQEERFKTHIQQITSKVSKLEKDIQSLKILKKIDEQKLRTLELQTNELVKDLSRELQEKNTLLSNIQSNISDLQSRNQNVIGEISQINHQLEKINKILYQVDHILTT